MLRTSQRLLRPLATPACRRSMGVFDKLKDFFVQAPELDVSQGNQSAKNFRAKAPGSMGEAVVPRELPGSQYTTKYFNRDTRTGGEWHYKDAEGKPAEVTPMKYMDGTPFLKKPEGIKLAPELMGPEDLKPEDWYFGERDENGNIPADVLNLGPCVPPHIPKNVQLNYKSREGLPPQPGPVCEFETVKDFVNKEY